MIDFPASPVIGQIFVASNGVSYQWNGTLWQTNSAGGTGDFSAYNSAAINLPGSATTLIFDTVRTGNTGLWYNTANGRWTPPAGRYFISATLLGMSASAPVAVVLQLAKNGIVIDTSIDSTYVANAYGAPTIGISVDANGVDYFTVLGQATGTGAQGQAGGCTFTGFPLTGLQGPPGPMGIPSGDFWAINSANLSGFTANVNTQVIPNTVGNGNSGNWYNPSTGRYTPPAGRYHIYATCVAAAGAAVQFFINLRKNGVAIPGATSMETPPTSGYYDTAKIGVNIDANGTDYFDLTFNPNAGGSTIITLNFGAFSLNAGPPGPTGPAGPVGTPPVGDFAAAGTPGITTTPAAMIMPVVNGNSGSPYNAATGRYTPPAGRYNLYAAIGAYSNTGGIGVSVGFRKNGAVIGPQISVNTPGANQWGVSPVETQVDANGTDYFELFGSVNPAATGSAGYFGAFPLTGIAGQAGAFGTGYRTISNQTLAVAQPSVDVQLLPVDINNLEINFDLAPTVNDVDCILQFYDAGGVLITTGYIWSTALNWSTAANAAAVQQTSSSSTGLTNGIYMDFAAAGGRVSSAAGNSIAGTIFIRNILSTTKNKQANFNDSYIAGNNAYLSGINGNGSRNATGKITGFRLSFNGGSNVAAGSNVTAWGSP